MRMLQTAEHAHAWPAWQCTARSGRRTLLTQRRRRCLQCGGKLQREYEGAAYDCFARALRGLAAAKLTKPGSFRTADQSGYALRCSYKALPLLRSMPDPPQLSVTRCPCRSTCRAWAAVHAQSLPWPSKPYQVAKVCMHAAIYICTLISDPEHEARMHVNMLSRGLRVI